MNSLITVLVPSLEQSSCTYMVMLELDFCARILSMHWSYKHFLIMSCHYYSDVWTFHALTLTNEG